MTTYKFEVAAKNAIIKAVKSKYDEDYGIEDISVVWMTHVLGHKKGIFIDNGKNQRRYEVTYSGILDHMYLDIYEKVENKLIESNEFDFTAVKDVEL